MKRWLVCPLLIVLAGLFLSVTPSASGKEPTAAERGREVLLHSTLTPAIFTAGSYDELWKQWGLKEKPANYDQAVRQRYGLHAAPYDNGGVPIGFRKAPSLFGQGLENNCLLCHASTIAGQTVIGLGNSALDLQGLFEDLSAASNYPLRMPFQFSSVRGTINPLDPVAFLMQFRDAELEQRKAIKLQVVGEVASDPPAWWLLKKKKTRDWTGSIDARSDRVDMLFLLSPLNSGEYIRSMEPAFTAINAFVLSAEPPPYPFPVDRMLADRGKPLFEQHCAKCHGTYGPGGSYPNKIVPLGVIGTDRLLAESQLAGNAEQFNKSWFARQLGPNGKPYAFVENNGYQAPPLDGIWATAPYFHNSSAPTVYHVLNSKARPTYYTRSYRTGKEDYDPAKLGWKITVLDGPADPKLPGYERRKVYDTTRTGLGNGGHTFGDELREEERLAVIEYLKTL